MRAIRMHCARPLGKIPRSGLGVLPLVLICLTATVLAGCDGGESPAVTPIDYVENARGALEGRAGPAYARGFTAGLAAESDDVVFPEGAGGRQAGSYSTGFQFARQLLAKGDDPDALAAIAQIQVLIQENDAQP